MLSRRAVLALSALVALAAHALLLAVAPRVLILRAHTQPEPLPSFQVKLEDLFSEPVEQAAPVDGRGTLASRPGRVEDMLAREEEQLRLDSSLLDRLVELPDLEARVATESLEREYDLNQDPEVVQKVDAKIIEIAQQDARKDVEVARRFVRPSPNRVLGPEEFPSLRGVLEGDRSGEVLLSAPSLGSSLGERAQAPSSVLADKGKGPAFEEGVLDPEAASPSLAALPLEHSLMHLPVLNEVRNESPYEFMDDLVDIRLDTFVPPDEAKGYFRLQIVPKEDEAIDVLPKDVTFIVDSSNSILERKLKSTANGIKEMVAKLRPEDRFNIVVFRDTATQFRPEPVSATPENKVEATSFLSGLESRGQTNVYEAIRPVLGSSPREGVPGIVLVMTDGRPTAGVVDSRSIINALTAENDKGNTIFAYSGGNTVNQYLLDLLAYRNKGEAHVSPRLEDIDRDLPRFFERLGDPLLVNLDTDYGRIQEDGVFPKRVPDFYRGRAVTVYGRFDPKSDKDFSMRLTGQAGQNGKELVFKTDLSKAKTGDQDIARNWAFQKIYYLIGEICRVGEKPELLSELRHLSAKYNIKTSYD
ncbi:MAG TPA: VWA domain-containing protein [Candidatus Hydrogenedentes bacterium]|nr:VWA domain-containing protein [Candidatus Hydrogenedentota bacterium]HPG68439.1 VWA domain-containing protein [Candidatus Hydrogenedentota bacterium]